MARSGDHRPRPGKTVSMKHRKSPFGYPVKRIPRGAISILPGGGYFSPCERIFYQWQDAQYTVVVAPVLSGRSSGYSVEVIDGETYYLQRDGYYRRTPDGDLVVCRQLPGPPEEESEPGPEFLRSATVWVQNENGSRTPVQLTASGDGQWIGPKGEYYPGVPSEAQLKPVYGMSVNTGPAEAPPLKKILWIENTNGSKTPVELEQQADGTWIGPIGEVYNELPSAEDLRSAYGLD